MTIEEHPEKFTNTRKADFKSIYNEPDPRAYFKALVPLQYQIPQQALPYVRRVVEFSASFDGGPDGSARPRKILDVCCSYGINAALLRHDLDMDTLGKHYNSSGKASPEEQIASDGRFFAGKLSHPELDVVGLDIAPEAIDYSVATGLMSDGWAENLEASDASLELCAALKGVDVVVCTGGVGYVGANTFSRIAAAVEDPSKLWMVTFVLRVFNFEDIAGVLAESFGLVTEKVPGKVFRQRKFTSREEQNAAIADVRARGLDPAGMEGDGWFCAECYVTKPKDAKMGVSEVLGDLLNG